MKFVLAITILILSFFLLNSCSIKEITDTANDAEPTKNPTWDYEVTIPVLDKSYNINDFYKTLPSFTGSFDSDELILPGWAAGSKTPGGVATISTISPMIDFDGNGSSDVNVTGIRSLNSKITLKFTLKDSSSTVERSLNNTNIVSAAIDINGTTYGFSDYYLVGNSIVFKSQLLQPVNDYCISLGNLTIDNLSVTLGAAAPAGFAAGDKLYAHAELDFGSDVEAIINIPTDVLIYSQSIPLGSIPLINNYKISVQAENEFASKLKIDFNSQPMVINTGNLSLNLTVNHYYSTSSFTSNGIFIYTNDGTDPTIQFTILNSDVGPLAAGADDIRLSRSGKIRFLVTVNGATN